MKRLCAVTLLIVVSVGCGNARLTRNTPDPTADGEALTTTTASPEASAEATAPAAATAKASSGSLKLEVFDANGLHPAGIPVEIAGERFASGEGGVIVFKAKPGEYSARVIAGCHRDVFVRSGGTARFRIVGDRVTTGTIRADWVHRYGPSGPARATVVGDWPIGTKVDVQYAVIDHCSQERAKSVAFPWFSFHTSSNLDLVGTPSMRADAKGNAVVSARCTARGAIGLVLRDRDDPKATFPLGDHLADYGGTPECG